MLDADKGTPASSDRRMRGKHLLIGIVQARFNAAITDQMAQASRLELLELGVLEKNIDLVQVPGALEIPLALMAMAEKSRYDALIALGCIIRGETYHFELVADQSGAGVTRVALDYQLPVANAILTTEDVAQAVARQVEKARDAARVAVEMANLMELI